MNCKQILYIFYNLILGIFTIEVESFTPRERVGHSSILIGTKLYFFGGSIPYNSYSNEVFYLDVSQTFNIASPPWTDLTISAKIPFGSSWAGMSLIDINDNPTVYLFGGIMKDPVSLNDKFVSIIHSFSIKTLEWKMPYINGIIPERRIYIHAVSDNKGNLCIFGGSNSVGTQFFNDMVILNTTSLTWSYGSILNVPIKRDVYSATILTNGIIVYIGGQEITEKRIVDINQINLYDTNLNTWSVMIARNTNLIESRFGHSAVLDPDGNIIIYGGAKYSTIDSKTLISAEPDVAMLNTQNTPFEWIVPTVSSNIGKIPSLFAPTANLVGNYMIVAFGAIFPYSINTGLNSKIYIMDIRNYTWIDTFKGIQNETSPSPLPTVLTPTSSTSHSPTALTPTSNDATKNAIIGALSGILGTAFLSIIGFLGYKWHKKQRRKQGEILNIPGSI